MSFEEEAYTVARPLSLRIAARVVATGGLPASERDDVASELLLAFWQKLGKFDRTRASLRTFAACVMNHRVVSIVRRYHARRRYPSGGFVSLEDVAVKADGNSVPLGSSIPDPRTDMAASHNLDFSIDVRRVLDSLPITTRRVAIALSQASPAEACRRLGCSRTWIYQQIAVLRRAFESAGLAPAHRRRIRHYRTEVISKRKPDAAPFIAARPATRTTAQIRITPGSLRKACSGSLDVLVLAHEPIRLLSQDIHGGLR
jgi:DNA-directed RNA polymerase specialized sigma24 family protein